MAKRNLDFDDFFWLPIFGFKSIGIDFLQTSKSNLMKRLLNAVAVFTFLPFVYVQFYIIQQFPTLDFRHNMLPIMVSAGSIAFAINGNVKFFFLLANRKRVCKIYNFLKRIYPGTTAERDVCRVDKYYYTKKELAVTITFFSSCWLLAFVPLIQSSVEFIYDWSIHGYNESNFKYLRFYQTEQFINHRSPWSYAFVYVVESANCHYLILTNLGSDLWLIPFATLVRMHLDQISKKLESLSPDLENSKSYAEEMVEIIQNHQQLMNIHSELKTAFEICMAFNIIATIGLLCTVAIRVWLSGFFNEFLFFSYWMSAVLQFYRVCYHGQKLTESSENVADSAYNSQWYNASPKDRKILLVLMIRAGRPAHLDVVGGPPISLDTFKIVLTVAYRIFAIFQSMLED